MKRLICLAVFLLMAALPGSADLFFQPQFSTVNVGTGITIDVMYSGAVAPWLGAYDIDIGYDPSVLSLSAVAWPDNYLRGSLRDADFGAGTVNVAEISLASVSALGNAQSGNDPFRLFELLFSGVAPGVSSLTFDRVLLADGNGDLLAAGNTPAGRVTVSGSIGVPEPGAWLFLFPTLSSLALLRIRQRR